ncbi:MAG: ABC transporter ATP-binding protein [Solirubrobacteraceae bacterium]
MSAVLRVSALSKSYGGLHALRGVSFEVAGGEVLAVLGPNGAGKTTLLSIIAGIQSPSAGSVSVTAREVGWAPQQPAVYGKLTVRENLELFARLERVEAPAEVVARMLEQAGLQRRAGDRVELLSGGNRQRVNVAVALIARPPVLALDEPSAALDPAQRERLWRFVRAMAAEGTAVIFSTHNAGEAHRHASRVLVLDEGRERFDGTPAQLLARAAGAGPPHQDLEQALLELLDRAGAPDR